MTAIASTSPARAAPRHDPLAEFNQPAAAPIDLRGVAKACLAWLLVGAGVGVSVWLVYVLHAVIFRPAAVGLFERLVPSREQMVLTIPAGRVELPPGAMPAVAYVLLIITFAIAARVAVALFKEGATLARHDPARPESAAAPRAADHPRAPESRAAPVAPAPKIG